jgi:hypothetical protein
MRVRIALILLVSVITLPTLARDSMFTPKELFDACSDSSVDSEGDIFCSSYLSGFVAGMIVGLAEASHGDVCLPRHFMGAEARAVFLRIVRTDPRILILFLEPNYAVFTTFAKAFPCGRLPKH